MSEPVTIKQLISILIRRGRFAIILMLVSGILLGCYRANYLLSSYSLAPLSPDQIEKADAQYMLEEESLISSIDNANKLLIGELEYNRDSLLMKINPYCKWVSSVLFMVADYSSDNGRPATRNDNPLSESVINTIEQQYLAFYAGANLQAGLSDTIFSATDDRYIRELVSFDVEPGGLMLLQASAATEEESQVLAEGIVQILNNATETISLSSAPHSLMIISRSDKTMIDEELALKQAESQKGISLLKSSIKSLEKELEEMNDLEYSSLQKPINMRSLIRSTVKYSVLGFFLGAVLYVVLVFCLFIFRNRLEFTSQIKDSLRLPFLGEFTQKQNIWSRLADKILNESNWKTSEEAAAYIHQLSSVMLQGASSVAIVSSLPIAEEDENIQSLMGALKEDGREITFINSAPSNPRTAAAIQNSQKIILAERKQKSRMSDIVLVSDLVESIEKKISAYVLI